AGKKSVLRRPETGLRLDGAAASFCIGLCCLTLWIGMRLAVWFGCLVVAVFFQGKSVRGEPRGEGLEGEWAGGGKKRRVREKRVGDGGGGDGVLCGVRASGQTVKGVFGGAV